jgi:hypothetical protein
MKPYAFPGGLRAAGLGRVFRPLFAAFPAGLVLAFLVTVSSVRAAETNLLRNGSFEDHAGGFPEWWSSTLGVETATRGTVSLDTGWAGVNSLKLDCTTYPGSPGTLSVADLNQTGFAAIASGQTYRLTFWAKAQNVGSGSNVLVSVYDAANDYSPLTDTVPVTATWARYEYEFVAGQDIPKAASVLSYALKETGTVWIDQVSLAVRNASVLSNSSFETWSSGFPTGWSYTASPTGVVRSFVQDTGSLGASSLKIDCTTYPASPDSSSHADVYQYGPALSSGAVMRLSFRAKGANIGNVANARVRIFDTSTWAYNPLNAAIAVTGSWQRFEFEFPVTQNVSSPNNLLWFTLDEAGTLWLDDVQYSVRDASLAANGSFETWSSGFPTAWSRTTSPAGVTVSYASDTGVFGPTALKIDCTVYPGSPSASSHADVFQTGQTLLKGETYRLSFWAKGANIGSTANVRAKVIDAAGSHVALDQAIDVTGTWQKFTLVFPATTDVNGADARLWFCLDEVGTLWLDDISYTKEERPANLVATNSSFESWSGGFPTGWSHLSSPSGVTVAYSADTGRVGSQSLKILCSAYPGSPASTSHADLQQTPTDWVKGMTYRLSFWAKGQNLDVANSVKVWMVDTSTWTYIPLAQTFTPTGTWQRFEFDVPIAYDVAQNNALLWFTLDEAATLWLDEVYLTAAPSAPSRYTPVVAAVPGAVNLLPNGGFEAGAAGWGSLGSPTGYSGGLTELFGTVETSGAYEGSRVLKISHAPGVTPVTYYDSWPATSTTQTRTLAANVGWIELKRGKEYTLSAYLKASVANVPVRMAFRFSGSTSGTGTITLPMRSTLVTVGTSWQRYTFTTTALERDAYIAVGPDLTGSGITTADVYVDAVQLEEASSATTYAKREPVEIGIHTDDPAGFFDAAQSPVIRLVGHNSTGSQSQVTVYLDLVDYFDQVQSQQSTVFTIPANSSATSNWTISFPATGFYRAALTWSANGNAHRDDRRFVYLDSYRQTDGLPYGWTKTSNPYGVSMSITADEPAAAAGLVSAKIDCTAYPGSPNSSSHADLFQYVPAASNGDTMFLSFRAKGTNIGSTSNVRVRVVDTSTWTYLPVDQTISVTGSWQKFDIPFTLTQNIAAANHVLWFTLDEVGTLWLDDVAYTRNGTNLLLNGTLEAFPDSPFGINHAPVTSSAARTLRRAGLTWARNWAMNWNQIQPAENSVSYAVVDAQIQHELDSGFRVLALMPTKPSASWSSSAPGNEGLSEDLRNAYAPSDPAYLSDFIAGAVTHAKSAVRHWEFLNEPVWTTWALPHPDYDLPGGGYTVADYFDLLSDAGNPAIRGSDASGNLIGGLSAPSAWSDQNAFITGGGLAYIDTYNLHEYGGYSAPESYISSMDSLLALMDLNGGRKPIWITEQAYFGLDDLPWYPWLAPEGYFAATWFLPSERVTADWSVRYCAIMLARNVRKIFWHQGSTGEVNNGTLYTENPFMDSRGQPTKTYAAIAVLAGKLGPAPVFGAALSKAGTVNGQSTAGVQGYAFDVVIGGVAKSVLICWVDEASAPAGWTLTAPSGTGLSNIMGASIAGLTTNLGVSPVYLVSTTKTAAQLASQCTLNVP